MAAFFQEQPSDSSYTFESRSTTSASSDNSSEDFNLAGMDCNGRPSVHSASADSHHGIPGKKVMGMISKLRSKSVAEGMLQHHLEMHKNHKLRRTATVPSVKHCQYTQNRRYSAATLGQLAALQEQYQQVAAGYEQLRKDVSRARSLRQRLARAKLNSTLNKASQALQQSSSRSQSPQSTDSPQLEQQQFMEQQESVTSTAPSLPALTLVVRMLLEVAAAKASPVLANQLRQQLLQQVKAAAAAAKLTGMHFSVAAAVHSMLPGLRCAVLQACKQQEQAAAATVAAVETALNTATCEAQLCCLKLDQPLVLSDLGCRSGSMVMNIEHLLQTEVVSTMCPHV
eukprot:gene5501-5736_t